MRTKLNKLRLVAMAYGFKEKYDLSALLKCRHAICRRARARFDTEDGLDAHNAGVEKYVEGRRAKLAALEDQAQRARRRCRGRGGGQGEQPQHPRPHPAHHRR